ncbi:porin family protein [Alysiella filiformis]|uniref:Outer membrane autotransporter barrel domain-containing protein n=1 Tax=Alysiella filiformis DSM 16848 TaxID=1120981 RepID=A0A286E3G7_9NEIS|nr:porin family protein [Alysiella filiformis]QMT31088.1 porin family protein [Alysiella filiformis]UBQ55920.1 porin family protein [Alysiella filiformis DSM 16848]SOD65447.1 outer membrane autotransporter barrel domain-containing protein [Alysiella filiformis DSM 16848]
MKTVKVFSVAAVLSAAFASFGAQAGVVTDAHGNVGYDTAAECDAAVLAGEAKFYQTFTHKSPLIRKGEKSVTSAKISDLGEEYKHGACDLGAARKLGRDGVSTALQGKYVPFSPDMPINVYLDAQGKALRVSMGQCDNWFSGNAPRAVVAPAPVAKEEAAPVVEETAAPAIIAPVLAKAAGLRPYVFGTVGAANEKVELERPEISLSGSKTKFAGQAGVGVQFNKYLGAEAFYQTGAKHKYVDSLKQAADITNQVYGGRLTLGKDFTDNFRLFAKVGAAETQHKQKELENYKDKRTVPTAGVGLNYHFNDNVSLRADYDHHFKSSKKNYATWKGNHYLGAGLQYKF